MRGIGIRPRLNAYDEKVRLGQNFEELDGQQRRSDMIGSSVPKTQFANPSMTDGGIVPSDPGLDRDALDNTSEAPEDSQLIEKTSTKLSKAFKEVSRLSGPPSEDDCVDDASLRYLPPALRIVVRSIRHDAEMECKAISEKITALISDSSLARLEKRIRGVRMRAGKAELKAIKDYNIKEISAVGSTKCAQDNLGPTNDPISTSARPSSRLFVESDSNCARLFPQSQLDKDICANLIEEYATPERFPKESRRHVSSTPPGKRQCRDEATTRADEPDSRTISSQLTIPETQPDEQFQPSALESSRFPKLCIGASRTNPEGVHMSTSAKIDIREVGVIPESASAEEPICLTELHADDSPLRSRDIAGRTDTQMMTANRVDKNKSGVVEVVESVNISTGPGVDAQEQKKYERNPDTTRRSVCAQTSVYKSHQEDIENYHEGIRNDVRVESEMSADIQKVANADISECRCGVTAEPAKLPLATTAAPFSTKIAISDDSDDNIGAQSVITVHCIDSHMPPPSSVDAIELAQMDSKPVSDASERDVGPLSGLTENINTVDDMSPGPAFKVMSKGLAKELGESSTLAHARPIGMCKLSHEPQVVKRSMKYISRSLRLTGMYRQILPLNVFLAEHLPQYHAEILRVVEQNPSQYLVCVPTDAVLDPEHMPSKHRMLCSKRHGEQILRIAYYHGKDKKPKFNTDAEFYDGPWRKLAEVIGYPWVVYLFMHTRVLQQREDQTWLHLWGRVESSRIEPAVSAIDFKGSGHLSDTDSYLIDKSDMMYRRSSFAFNYLRIEKDAKGICPLVLAQIQRIEPKLQKLSPRIVQHPEFTPPCIVAKVLHDILDPIFLRPSLLGPSSNYKSFDKNLIAYLKLPKFQKIPVQFFSRGVKTGKISWLRDSKVRNEVQQRMLRQLLHWMVAKVVNPLLVHLYYMTERSGAPTTLYYYDRVTWSLKQSEGAIQHGLNDIESATDEKGEPWRLVPKADGSTRIIVNMRERNKKLEDAHAVLQSRIPHMKSNLNSWHDWLTEMIRFQANQVGNSRSPTFYVVKFDISSCYDSSDVDKVKRLTQILLNNGEDSYSRTSVLEFLGPLCQYSRRKTIVEVPGGAFNPATEEYRTKSKPSIIVERESQVVDGADILLDIDNLLQNLRLRVRGGKSLPFTSGIPQGSSCSNDLCDLMLNDLVKNELSFAESSSAKLIRYVDDFLFLTVKPELATRVYEASVRGFSAYNLYCKQPKVLKNFGESKVDRVKFLGIEINCADLTPCQMQVPDLLPFGIPFSDEQKQARVAQEFNQIGIVLRAYRYAKVPAPPNVVLDSAFVLGRVLGRRLTLMSRLSRKSEESVYKSVVDKYLLQHLENASADVHNRIRAGYLRSLSRQRHGDD